MSILLVTTFAVVWIEIVQLISRYISGRVTTFAVVWIEIASGMTAGNRHLVTTFAVVWIEITDEVAGSDGSLGHHLRGGVD